MKQLIYPIIKRAFLFAALLLSATQAFANNYGFDFVSNGLYYRILSEEEHAVEVIGYSSTPSNLEIPAQVTYLCKIYVVTAIGVEAFRDCTALTTVNIGNSVTTIGDFAFCDCEALISVDIPDSVTTIGEFAFHGCEALISVDIPDSVTTIGEHAFGFCEALISVDIPDSVTTIGDDAFSCCHALISVDIPDSVTTIGYCAFYECSALISVNIPNSVTSIGHFAFAYCAALTYINIPNSVTSIGSGAFESCTSLTEINVDPSNPTYSSIDGVLFSDNGQILHTFPGGRRGAYSIPKSVTTIGDYAFCGCYALTTVNIPDSVTTIGDDAFEECYALTTVDIPDSVTTIGDDAFEECDALTSVNIGNCVTTIGDFAFNICDKLESIYCEPTTPPIYSYIYTYLNCFSGVVYDNATLYIPTGTLNAYLNVDPWKNFQHIEEMDFDAGVDGVETDDAEAVIKAEGGVLMVSGADSGLPVEVYDTNGRMVYRGNDSRIEGLSHGIYIVRISDTVKKISL